jgi:hypothetical protein
MGTIGSIELGAAYHSNDFYPRPSDSNKELKRKYELNKNAAVTEIPIYVIDPYRDHDELTEYQSNALTAKQYLEQKKKHKK